MRLLLLTLLPAVAAASPPAALDVAAAGRFAGLALTCVHQEYPNKIAHVLQTDADARPPRELTPAFHGCFDWHSAVHGHWLLARLARLFPDAPFAGPARAALARSLTAENVAAEVRYLRGTGRTPSSAPTASPGSFGSRASSAPGTTPPRASGWRRFARSRSRPSIGSGRGSRSSDTRSGSASTPDGVRLRARLGLGASRR